MLPLSCRCCRKVHGWGWVGFDRPTSSCSDFQSLGMGRRRAVRMRTLTPGHHPNPITLLSTLSTHLSLASHQAPDIEEIAQACP